MVEYCIIFGDDQEVTQIYMRFNTSITTDVNPRYLCSFPCGCGWFNTALLDYLRWCFFQIRLIVLIDLDRIRVDMTIGHTKNDSLPRINTNGIHRIAYWKHSYG